MQLTTEAKPHVERGVPYVRERLFKGGSFLDLADLRSQASSWCREVAGQRVHGTTRWLPLVAFRDQEQTKLLPFDGKPYAVPAWARLQVHLDHHIAFQYALYSVPSSLCPPRSSVEVSADDGLVRIYHRGNLVKTHLRQQRGGRSTDPTDYPPEKSSYAQREPTRLCQQASELGPSVGEFARRLLGDEEGPWTRFRQAQKLLRLGQRYTPTRLDLACARALSFDLLDVRRLERILREALDGEGNNVDSDVDLDVGARQAANSEEHSESASLSGPNTPPANQPSLSARFARPGSAFARAAKPTVQPATSRDSDSATQSAASR